MRLRSIAFAPFGALRDVAIDLDGPPGAVHVVYGPNEAGKSTALRGLIGFFFGIPHRTADQHEARQVLRVRARIELDDGRILERVRRKGTKDTLLDGTTDAPVADDEIRRWIGGLDEATFRQLHALDHVRLREGAEAVLRGRGKLGELLLEASTGATGLSDRLERLREEAAALYRPRGRTDALHLAEDAWQAAARQSADAMLSYASWREQERSIEELRKRVDEADRELREARAEHERLSRLQRVEETQMRLRRKRAARRALGPVRDVPEGTTALRDEHAREAAEAAAEAERAEAELARQRAAAAAAARRAEAASATFDPVAGRALRGRIERAQASRAEAVAELEAIDRALAAAEASLGPPPPGHASWSTIEVDKLIHARALARAADRREASAARVAAERALAEAHARRDRLGDPPPTATDPDAGAPTGELVAAIAAGRRAATAARARDDLAAREVEAMAKIAAHVAAAGAASSDELVVAGAPDAATLAAEERERVHARAALAALVRERDAEGDRAARAGASLEALRGGAGLPAEAELDRLRGDRDALVDRAARALDDGDARGAASVLRGLAAAVHRADAVADRLRHDAARVEHAAQLEAERRRAEARGRELDAQIERARADGEARAAAWQARWPAIAGRDDEAVRSWCTRREAVLALEAELRATRARLAELDAEVALALQSLRSAVGPSAGGGASTPAGLEALLALAELRAEEARRREQLRDERASALARADDDVRAAEREVERARAAEQRSLEELDEVVRPLGLARDASHEETAALASALLEATRGRRQREAAAARLARLDAEIAEATAAWTAAARDAGLGGLGFEEAITRAEAARDARRELERLEEAMIERSHVVARQRERRDRATVRLVEIQERTGLPPDQLAAAEAAAQQARALDRDLQELEALLVDRLGAASIGEAEERLSGVDFGIVGEHVERAAQAIVELEARRDRDNRAIGSQEEGLRLLGGESRASELAEQAEAHLARARALARRAAVARAAVALLEQAIEQHRSDRQGPVLGRAASIFRALTGDLWSGLQVAEAEDGELEIRCLRDGLEHPVSALSQGTADQLYLALRLAAIEHQARGGVRLPLLLDDVLVHFDQERKLAALRALADVAREVQVILFTHERDAADAARIHLGDRAVVHELARRG